MELLDLFAVLGTYLMPIVSFLFMYLLLENKKNRVLISIFFALMMWAIVGEIILLQGEVSK